MYDDTMAVVGTTVSPMEIWIALIAVLGTLGGAIGGPLVANRSSARTVREQSEAAAQKERAEALRNYLEALVHGLNMVNAGYEAWDIRKATQKVQSRLLDLAAVLRPGEGSVHEYVNAGTNLVFNAATEEERSAYCTVMIAQLWTWMRGEWKPDSLQPFTVDTSEAGQVSWHRSDSWHALPA